MRVLSFISGGYLPATVQGTRTSAVVHIADWYATFCGLAGKGTCPYLLSLRVHAALLPTAPGVDPTDELAAASGLPPIDSLDLWPLISGVTLTSPRWEWPIATGDLMQFPLKLLSGSQVSAYPMWLYT